MRRIVVRIEIFSAEYGENGESKIFPAKNRTSYVNCPVRNYRKIILQLFFGRLAIFSDKFLFSPLPVGIGEIFCSSLEQEAHGIYKNNR